MAERMKLCVIEGDGIGREVIPPALRALQLVLPNLEVIAAHAGYEMFQAGGEALPQATLEAARAAGAVLFGAVSSPLHSVEGYSSPIVALRRQLGVYANLRPTRGYGDAPRGVNLLIVRENTEGLYSGRERIAGDEIIAERVITRKASERIARAGFEAARRHGFLRLTVVHKANILRLTDGLFREAVLQVAAGYPEIAVEEMLVDTAAYWMVRDPARFQVIVTTNLFGDILSDAASAWGGSLGMAASLSLGENAAIAEPVHGSAPDIAGRDLANPVGALLSAAMLAESWFRAPQAGQRIRSAVSDTLQSGICTADLTRGSSVGTQAFSEAVFERL